MSRLTRLSSLTVGELACRVRQRAARWWDVVSPAFGPTGEARNARRRRCDGRESALSLDAAAVRFFPGVAALGTGRTVDGVIARAEAILTGRFDLLGYRGLMFGTPIDWHVDPVSQRRAPMKHWSRIDALDVTAVGDSKVIWELNRHQWMLDLAQAYLATGDQRFARAAVDRMDEWTGANPYPLGINWSSSLEVSFRLIAWCWTMLAVRESDAVDGPVVARWQTLLRAHARHIERYLSTYYSPNTHLTGEALGLVYAGVVLAGSADAARWRDVGGRVLAEELRRQVGPDGMQFEHATCYQRYTADIYLQWLLLARRNRLPLPADAAPAVARLARALLMLRQPDGAVPNVGDADGGALLPLVPREAGDCRGTFGVAAAIFRDAELAWAAGPCPPEVSWLCGADAVAAFGAVAPRAPAILSGVLEHSYAVMRTGWDPGAHQMILDAAPLGCPISGAHGHADLLSIQCVAFGEPYLIDPGTYCYTADPIWRDHFRGTAAHNTLLVDARPQAATAGPFSWKRQPRARLHAFESTSAHDFADGSHDGYGRGRRRLRHRRRIVFLKPTAWIVIDDIEGRGAHDLDLRFQFAPAIVVAVENGWIRARGAETAGLWMQVHATQGVDLHIHLGQTNPIAGWASPAYGLKVPAPLVRATTGCRDEMRLVTVLVPESPLQAAPPKVEWMTNGTVSVSGVQIPADGREVRFDAARVSITPMARQRSA